MMNGLRDRLQHRAGLVALAASAGIFAVLTLAKAHTKMTPVYVPIVEKFISQGSHVGPQDIKWVNEVSLHTVGAGVLQGFAKVPLFPGQVVSPQDIGKLSQQTVIVAVSPTNGIDARVAISGDDVDILLENNQRVEWQSGPLPVLSRSLGEGTAASVNVVMAINQALTYESLRNHGTIELVGLTS